jgi:hypothetical protein
MLINRIMRDKEKSLNNNILFIDSLFIYMFSWKIYYVIGTVFDIVDPKT